MKPYISKSITVVLATLAMAASAQPVTQEVCLVTVDLTIQKNIVVWEKISGQGIKGFKIYKEDTAGVYDSIAYVPFDSLSAYTDYSSDPRTKPDRYYITALDSNNLESTPGAPHKTIRFWVQLDTNNMPVLNWDNYEGFFYPKYRIWRGTSPSNVAVFDSVGWSTTTYSDTMQADTLYYLGEVVRFAPCSATVKLKTYNASKSNTASLVIPSLVLTATAGSTSVTCPGGNDGTATVSVAAGTTPYSYLWNDPQSQTAQTATGLTAGNYLVLVSDGGGDMVTANTTVTEPPAITITVSSDSSICGGSDGSATALAGGGNGGFAYSWNNGQNSPSATGLSAASYSVTVTDSLGCNHSATVDVYDTGTPLITTSFMPVLCYGESNGTATALAIGGVPPYTYNWDSLTAYQNNSTATGLSAGSYSVTISDNYGCTSSQSVTVTEPDPFITSGVVTNATDPGDNDGAIDILVSGGTLPYSYSWNTGSSTEDIDSLPSGTYIVSITDSNNCSLSDTFQVLLIVGEGDVADGTAVKVFPNPASSVINIYVGNSPDAGHTQLKIYNIFAQEIFSRSLVQNFNPCIVNLQTLPRGVYYFELVSNEEVILRDNLMLE